MDEEIRAYYESGLELDRLAQGYSRIESARTKELLSRFLPAPPAHILDVGGGPGAYAAWLVDAGHEVRLVDATPLQSSRRSRSPTVASPPGLATRFGWTRRTVRTTSSSCSARCTTSSNGATD